jgi:DNA mismatch endonuclease (patch repair protein)
MAMTQNIPKPDHASSEAIRKTMQSNKGKDTRPELLVRKMLREAGFSGYRLHWKKAPGKPDIAYPGRKIAIFVNGCFWHRHPNCHYAYTPKSNQYFWLNKFEDTVERDQNNYRLLEEDGWSVFVVWECELKVTARQTMDKIVQLLRSSSETGEGCCRIPV